MREFWNAYRASRKWFPVAFSLKMAWRAYCGPTKAMLKARDDYQRSCTPADH